MNYVFRQKLLFYIQKENLSLDEIAQKIGVSSEQIAQWQGEKDLIEKVQSLRKNLEEVNAQIEKARLDYDLSKLSELEYGTKPKIIKEIEEAEKSINDRKGVLHDKVTEEEIADIMFEELKGVLAEKRLGLEITDRAKNYIVQNGYDPVYGARPLKRFISHTAQTIIAKFIIEFDPAENTVLTLDEQGDNLVVKTL